MKRFTFIPLALAALLTLSCQKSIAPVDAAPQEIVLAISEAPVEVFTGTKAITPVSSLPASLYWGATTGSGSESTKWASASGTVSAGKISTGKYQTATPTTYNYYLSNVSMSIGANTTVSATGGTSGMDVICGRASSNSATPSVTLDHIFARTGSITTTCTNGTVTGLSYTIKAKGDNTGTTGTYNLRTDAWSSTSGITSDTAITGSSDLYLIPGDYTIKATGTYTRGDYVATKTMTGTVTLTGGKINNIALAWPDGGTEIIINVTLTPWGSPITVNGTLEEPDPHTAVDMGGTSTVLYAAWNVGGECETDFGDYFVWTESTKRYTKSAEDLQNNNDYVLMTGATYEWSNTPYHTGDSQYTGWTKYIPSSPAFASYWGSEGDPDNKLVLDISEDTARNQWGRSWRLPTQAEWTWLVNSSNCNWTWQSDYNGSGVNGYLVTSKHNSASIFLPAAGICFGEYRRWAGREGFYLSSTLYNTMPESSATLYFYNNGTYEINNIGTRCSALNVRPVKSK